MSAAASVCHLALAVGGDGHFRDFLYLTSFLLKRMRIPCISTVRQVDHVVRHSLKGKGRITQTSNIRHMAN